MTVETRAIRPGRDRVRQHGPESLGGRGRTHLVQVEQGVITRVFCSTIMPAHINGKTLHEPPTCPKCLRTRLALELEAVRALRPATYHTMASTSNKNRRQTYNGRRTHLVQLDEATGQPVKVMCQSSSYNTALLAYPPGGGPHDEPTCRSCRARWTQIMKRPALAALGKVLVR